MDSDAPRLPARRGRFGREMQHTHERSEGGRRVGPGKQARGDGRGKAMIMCATAAAAAAAAAAATVDTK